MIRSMTGFGQGFGEAAGTGFKVEIKSVNNRFREIIVKMPRFLMPVEEGIKKLVSREVARGRVEVWINLESGGAVRRPSLNLDQARAYQAAMTQLQEELDLPGRVDLGLIAGFRDIIETAEEVPEMEAIQPGLEAAVQEALAGLIEMRAVEGERLARDLKLHLDELAGFVTRTETRVGEVVAAAQERLKERIAALVEQDLDPARLAQEAAILADKADVTEELVRLKSHLAQFHDYLDQGGTIGRKLDFLVQEIHREVNTCGVKLAQADNHQETVEAKAEVEKLKEQVQNLE